MKSRISILIFTIVGAVQFVAAQEKPRAVLVDHWIKIRCEDNLGRLDNYIVELQNDPAASGHVVIYYGERSLKERFENENVITAHFAFRKFDATRVKILTVNRGNDNNENAELKFWRIPAGADLPDARAESKMELAPISKAVRFGFPGVLCPYFSPQLYKANLEKYPDLRGHIVFAGMPKTARKNREYWLKRLSEAGVPKDRLRIFYSTTDPIEEAQFWLVPVKTTSSK